MKTIIDNQAEHILDSKFPKLKTKIDYDKLFTDIATNKFTRNEKLQIYKTLALSDLFFLSRYILNRDDQHHQWIYDRCVEIQEKNDKTVDLFARGHYKTSLITVALTIQQALQNPTYTFCIFSHTKTIALSFLRTIKNILKTNNLLRLLFPNIIPQPDDTSRLSEDKIRLLTNKVKKENSIDASGLVDGQPTGMHYDVRVYDDVVVPESVSTPDQIKKLQDAFDLSHNLSSQVNIARIIGTRYHHADLFSYLKEQGIWHFRVYPAEVNGKPVLLSPEQLEEKKRIMGSYIYSCQMLLNPAKSDDAVFSNVSFQYFTEIPKFKQVAILVDPAIAKAGCYSVIMAVGITDKHDIYLLDYISKVGMKPQEQAEAIYQLSHKWHTKRIGIEQVGYQQALKYITEDYFRSKSEYITVDELKPHKSKDERIIALLPYFENGQIYIRAHMKEFIQEVKEYPFSKYRDHIDVFAYSLQYFKPLIVRKESPVNNIDRSEIYGNNINKYIRGELKWSRRKSHLKEVNRIRRIY